MLVASILLLIWTIIAGFRIYYVLVRSMMNIANIDQKWYDLIIMFPAIILIWLIKKVLR